jgi:hypothetical protein
MKTIQMRRTKKSQKMDDGGDGPHRGLRGGLRFAGGDGRGLHRSGGV